MNSRLLPRNAHLSWPLVLLGVVLLSEYRVWLIQHTGITLFVDEAQYWDWSRHLDWGYYSKPPVIAWMIAGVTAVMGNGLLAVKSVGLLTYALTALAIYQLIKAMLDETLALWSALVWMCMPMVAGLSLFASTDGPLLLFWALSAWLLWRAQGSDRLIDWLCLGLAFGLGLLSKYTMAAFALTTLWALWRLPGPRSGLSRPGPWVALLVAVLCLAPNIWWNALHHFPTLHHTEEITTGSDRAGGWHELVDFLGAQIVLMGPAALICVIKAFTWPSADRALPESDQQLSLARNFGLALSLPLLVLAGAQALASHANVNWAAPAHIGLLILTLVGIARMRRPLTAFMWLLISNLLLMGVVLHMQDIAHALGRPLPSRYDILVRMRGWDQVLDEIKNRIPPELAVATDSRPWAAQIAYQWRPQHVHPYAWNPSHVISDHYAMTTDLNQIKGQDLVLLTENSSAAAFERYAQRVDQLGQVQIATGPKRRLGLHIYILRGFKGY